MSYESHHDWLSLIEISGPFLAVPVLKEAFPQGLEELDATKRKRLRQAYEEWREALELEDVQFAELHAAWVDEVLSRGLELDEDGKGDVLKRADWCAVNLKANLPEHGVTLSPDLAVVDEQRANKPLLLIQTYAQHIDLDATLKQDGWAATPADRMVALCRSLGCRLGLVTNGERWMLVDAPVGAVTTFASWYARIWSQEPITLQAFVHLLGIRRFFVDESEQLPALFDRSLKFQDEVTDALGEQVRRAVEVLIQTLDKADQDRDRELLHDVKESELYEAALTVMMRLVFLLSAEERGLLLMGDERYEANYALSTLRMQLRKESEEILERRWDAWSRLLAVFRAVFGGIEHENLRLPALGGSLFDPDRFPFLEGRAKGSNWRTDAATPLPIDNRTVLLLLEAIQQFQGRTLSYRALDVEQIGYVYEGLLERTVKRTDEVTLELDATKSAKTPWVKLAELDSARLDGVARLAELLQERSGSSASRVRNDLVKAVNDTLADRLLTACQGDIKLRDRVKPYAHLLRTDPWGYPLVYPAGAFIVTTGSDRRETGTHYTPKSLTEAIVAETLMPVAYVGPAEGAPRDQWKLKSPAELLDLKICDPAMGSGAFLVQACRWLSDRLVESWSQVEAAGKTVSVDGEVLEVGAVKEPLPRDSEARTVIARRLIAERCLYGVDLNPLAVELAKLSIWLVTLAKGRPFGFLDHNLRSGDSLLGVTNLDQLYFLDMAVGEGSEKRLFAQKIDEVVIDAIELRAELRLRPVLDIRDVEFMSSLDQQSRAKLELPNLIADALVGETLKSGGKNVDVTMLSVEAGYAFDGKKEAVDALIYQSKAALNSDLPVGKQERKAFHWCLEYPEIFLGERKGFDVIVGNPPFLGGRKIRGSFGGSYLDYLTHSLEVGASGNADLCAFFFLRSFQLLCNSGCQGLLATNSIGEGDTAETGLFRIVKRGGEIYSVTNSAEWPGVAAITVTMVHLTKQKWIAERKLDGKSVIEISASLKPLSISENKKVINSNKDLCYVGTMLTGKGFVLTLKEADEILNRQPKCSEVIQPYYTGEEIFNTVDLSPKRMVVNFFDWEMNKAQDFGAAFDVITTRVKPVRDKARRKAHRERWWQYGDKRPALYSKLAGIGKALVQTRHTKYLAPQFVNTQVVFSDSTVVFPTDSHWFFAVVNSTVHEIWARETSGTIRTELRYSHSDCFYTFPLPDKSDELEMLGVRYDQLFSGSRKILKLSVNEMLDRIHDPDLSDEYLWELRNARKEIDLQVIKDFGWGDMIVGYDFFMVEGRLRYTFDLETIDELKLRLLERNIELASQRIPIKANSKKNSIARDKLDSSQGSLF